MNMGLFFVGLSKFLSILSESVEYDYALFLYIDAANYYNYMAFNSIEYSAV